MHMPYRILVYLGLMAASFNAVAQPGQSIKCEIGPVAKTFGKVPWLVYGCDDGKSLVVISDKGSPAMPFYFMFFPKDGRYELVGEGTGRKESTAAAHAELKALTDSEIANLLHEVRSLSNPGTSK